MQRLPNIFERVIGRVATKGQDRHGSDLNKNFDDQPICQILDQLHSDNSPLLYQAVKKIYESRRLPHPASSNELLDAIAYLAVAIIFAERSNVNSN